MIQRSAYDAGLSHFPDRPMAYALYRGLGNATDDARRARADYFGQLAVHGNVAAARIVIGGTQNTSGNEQPYWSSWIDAMAQTPIGLQTLQAAQYLGAWWPVGSSDTVDSYPIMQKFVADWATANPAPPPKIMEDPGAIPPPPAPAYVPPPAAPRSQQQLPPPAMPSSDIQIAGFALSPTMLVVIGAGVLFTVLSSRRR